MLTAQTHYRGCTIVTQAAELCTSGHFVTKVEIQSLGATFNPPLICKPFPDAAHALEWTLAKGREIVDCMVKA